LIKKYFLLKILRSLE